MTDDREFSGDRFSIGGTRGKWTSEDLARFEERLHEAQAHLDEVSANVDSSPPLLYDPRHRTLPEELAASEERLMRAQADGDEATVAVVAQRRSLDDAGSAGPEELARLGDALSAAESREAEAAAEVQKCQRFVDRARENVPEDAEAEAQARVAHAEMFVEFAEAAVDDARADLLPERAREALELLAEHATDEWLDRYASRDEGRRTAVRPTVLLNIKSQLARAMLRPDLRALDKAINITGDPEPRPEGSGPPGAAGEHKPTEDQLADALNELRFGHGE
jgi:DNA repair exonuclease SbcCD ATPase subunit